MMRSSTVSAADLPPLRPIAGGYDLSAYDVPHPRPFVTEITVTAEHVSRAIPHVWNIEYVRWLDRAAELHSDATGFTRERMLGDGIMWFVARHEIDYEAEAWEGDHLLIATWVRSIRKVKSWRDYLIVRPADGTVITRAATLWVLVDLESRRPRRISPEMGRPFEPLEEFEPLPGKPEGD